MPNFPGLGGVWDYMKIHDEHLSEPGLAVVDITASDEEPATQAAAALGGLWRSSGPSAPWHTPGEAGVTVCACLDLRHPPLTNSFGPEVC
ncbi:DUF6207 family protein [Streptomyces sp. NPDC091266]|uniref:DUF6207 family protein n=1 Tax=Streptomyces sp. NPDC091266 TaxID=3365978 RepID=UPI00380C3397